MPVGAWKRYEISFVFHRPSFFSSMVETPCVLGFGVYFRAA
jgi:hypothetical protein